MCETFVITIAVLAGIIAISVLCHRACVEHSEREYTKKYGSGDYAIQEPDLDMTKSTERRQNRRPSTDVDDGPDVFTTSALIGANIVTDDDKGEDDDSDTEATYSESTTTCRTDFTDSNISDSRWSDSSFSDSSSSYSSSDSGGSDSSGGGGSD